MTELLETLVVSSGDGGLFTTTVSEGLPVPATSSVESDAVPPTSTVTTGLETTVVGIMSKFVVPEQEESDL